MGAIVPVAVSLSFGLGGDGESGNGKVKGVLLLCKVHEADDVSFYFTVSCQI